MTKVWESLYPRKGQEYQRQRYARIGKAFSQHFPGIPWQFFSVPGRTELGGNHTDHNQGKVLAGSIHLDAVAASGPSGDAIVTVYSEGYPGPYRVKLDNLDPEPSEKGSTSALIRGVASRFRALGYAIGGFNAWIHSEVLSGSGLSSSASVEVLFGAIFNHLFNNGQISPEKIAEIGQYAENVYFGKPCGLMDQTACAMGGIIRIDFEDPQKARIHPVPFDFASTGYCLMVVNTGGNHADLTPDYAAIPDEMKSIAHAFGKTCLREVSEEEMWRALPKLRQRCSDRAILRALHFFAENRRVDLQAAALEKGDFSAFLTQVKASGASSLCWLQNGFSPQNPDEQGIPLALALSESYLNGIGEGVCRVHGGGFAGTIQTFLPVAAAAGYASSMASVFGEAAPTLLYIRNTGIAVFPASIL